MKGDFFPVREKNTQKQEMGDKEGRVNHITSVSIAYKNVCILAAAPPQKNKIKQKKLKKPAGRLPLTCSGLQIVQSHPLRPNNETGSI